MFNIFKLKNFIGGAEPASKDKVISNYFVAFIHTYTGLGKSTFFRFLYELDPEFYDIISSDAIQKQLKESGSRRNPRDIFNQNIKKSKKIIITDKNFPTARDMANLSKFTSKIPIVLFVEQSFEPSTILLLLARLMERKGHETFTDGEDLKNLYITLSFINKSRYGYSQGLGEIVPINLFKYNMSAIDLEGVPSYKELLEECIKTANFRQIENPPKQFQRLLDFINANKANLNRELVKYHVNEVEYLEEVRRVDMRIKEIVRQPVARTVAASPKVKAPKPIYIGYFIKQSILNRILKKYGQVCKIKDPHVTMAFSTRYVKLFLMSEPIAKAQFILNGILVTKTHVVLDLDFKEINSPVKVSEIFNPTHITLASPRGKALESGPLLLRHKNGERVGEYLPIKEEIEMDLKVFNSDRTINQIVSLNPNDTLDIITPDSREKLEIESKIEEVRRDMQLKFIGVDGQKNIELVKAKYFPGLKLKKGKEDRTINYNLINIENKLKKELKKFTGSYSVKDEPNYELFQQDFRNSISGDDIGWIISLLEEGHGRFISSKEEKGISSEEAESFRLLLGRCVFEIQNIKIMHPNNFYYWSKTLFNWLQGLSNGPLVKIHEESGSDGSLVGYGFKTEARLDEKIYKENIELRKYLPRGIYFNTDKQLKNFAIRKFFGQGIDEDKDEGEETASSVDKGENLFGNEPTHFFATDKANGENAQLYVDREYIYLGSKNRKIRLRKTSLMADLEEYKRRPESKEKYLYAIAFTENILGKLASSGTMETFFNFLEKTQWTANFEFESVDSQHIVYLVETRSVLIGFSSPFIDGVTAHPYMSVLVAKVCGLDVVGENGTIQLISNLESYIAEMRQRENTEGDVIVEIDSEGRTLGLVKKKTIWYILLRAAREQLRTILNKANKGSITKEEAHSLIKTNIVNRFTSLFSSDYLSFVPVEVQRGKTEELVGFSHFLVDLFFTELIKFNFETVMSKYPLYYQMFKGNEEANVKFREFLAELQKKSEASGKIKYHKYYSKYMKYKNKYINLKNKLNKD